MKRGDALRIAELISRAEKAEKIVDEYAESARAIALWLSGFCNKKLSYPSMISDAARKISTAYAEIKEILGDNYDLSRLRELVQADGGGRCVVLPCKEGERIYKITPKYLNKYGCDHCLSSYGMGSVCEYYDESSGSCKNLIDPKSKYDIVSKHFSLEMVNEFGKTVFLTREEAEVALKERKKDE